MHRITEIYTYIFSQITRGNSLKPPKTMKGVNPINQHLHAAQLRQQYAKLFH